MGEQISKAKAIVESTNLQSNSVISHLLHSNALANVAQMRILELQSIYLVKKGCKCNL